MANIYNFYSVQYQDEKFHDVEIDFDTYNDARNFVDFLLSKVDVLCLISVVLKQISEFRHEG